MKNMMNWLCNEESGQGMVEYGLILALIAIVVIAAVTAIGGSLKSKFEAIGDSVSAAGSGT